ncbi:hypothetical protein, partial [Adlercreutzia sp. DFI.6.23]|uniref:hypothetical protein n=1 Tax=Adlercreutzia sp. DFI.6.23 TaxID=2963705 RepID=UPI00210A7386
CRAGRGRPERALGRGGLLGATGLASLQFGSRAGRAAAASAHPAAAGRPAAGVPAQAQGFAPVKPAYGAPSGARARHAR